MKYRILGCAAGAWLVAVLAWVLSPPAPAADQGQGKARPRKLLYPADAKALPPALAPVVEKLLSAEQKKVAPRAARPGGVFLRLVSKHLVMDGGRLKAGSWLGSRPFVFLTVPEAAYGGKLMDAFSAIGYSPEWVLTKEAGVEKVAVVFVYPGSVRPHRGRGGRLPDDWPCRVYPTTWDNLFALAEHLVADKCRVEIGQGDFPGPTKFRLRSEKERCFLASFPDSGKRRVKRSGYAALRQAGGADWEYRSLLERLLGASEHFQGNGRTRLTIGPNGKDRDGFPEFLGPNMELKDLPAVAVVGLGALRVSEE